MSEKRKHRRGICQHEDCTSPRDVYCPNHHMVLCSLHKTYYHFECKAEQFISAQELKNALVPVSNSLHQLFQYKETYDSLEYLIQNFGGALASLMEEFENLKGEIRKKIETDQFLEYMNLKKQVEEFYMKFRESDIYSKFKDYLFAKQLEDQTSSSAMQKGVSKQLLEERKKYEASLKNVAVDAKEKILQEAEVARARDIEELKNQIQDIQQQSEEQKSSISDHLREIEQLKTQIEDGKTQIEQLNETKDRIEEEFKTQMAEHEQLQETYSKMNSFICQQLWKKCFGEEKAFDLKTKIELKMADSNAQNFLKEVVDMKVRLPNIKRIAIDQNKKEDPTVRDFYLHCFPEQAQLFCYNWYYDGSCSQTKLDYYFEGLKRVIPCVTREVVLYDFEISKQEFEFIVSNTKAERLTISESKFDTSSPVAFDCPSSSIQYLSFERSGKSSRNDWKASPSKLKNILKAVSESALKDSIQTLNVYQCGLSGSEVKAMLPELGLTIGQVIDNSCPDPLSD
ncbi:unnamed protein product [Moneuplotes crassus]|uniref:Uncharacterized protein n=1 Tax=Euplotes crassus TaxID=5936 RepID=A0AAD1U472_EUPCR|nr:unnamed protein product [Moneuplotes crassus]